MIRNISSVSMYQSKSLSQWLAGAPRLENCIENGHNISSANGFTALDYSMVREGWDG